MIEAVLFDQDGTLVDSEGPSVDIDIAFLRRFGIPATPELIREFFGVKYDEWFSIAIDRYKASISAADMLKAKDAEQETYYGQSFQAMPHAQKVLRELSGNYKLGLVTGCEQRFVELALTRLEMLSYFTVIVAGDHVSHGKPRPDGFLMGAQKLGVIPWNVAAVEDSVKGFDAARAAGMHVIGYKTAHNAHQDFSLAHKVITDLREIPAYLRNII
ncbi:HAD family phosphatase [Candidatus Woesearchaeota archaeon]|nr:HAD family phosphatase [Candidatus Woesearchaeota archaeon]